MALRWLALMCCACGRIGFAPSDAAGDGPVPVIAAAQATGNSTTAAAIQAVFSAPVQDHDAIILCFTFPHGSATLLPDPGQGDHSKSLVLRERAA